MAPMGPGVPPVVAPPPAIPAMRPPGPVPSAGPVPTMGAPGMVAPPMMVAPPPMISPGGIAAPPPAVPMVMGGPAQPRVLVGFLVTFQNDPAGSFWPIYSGKMLMGRASGDSSIDIPLQDASASSRHASIHADPSTGQAYVEDDGSRNGTFLNEQRLAQGERRQMRDNDRLRLGSTTFVIKLLVS